METRYVIDEREERQRPSLHSIRLSSARYSMRPSSPDSVETNSPKQFDYIERTVA
ncbi:hypothetical protein ACFQJ7_09325 [Halovenus rubra]|uniref:Uncharacterized protein n=2 Tax=Halovenus rubra TaxID=869890 RepID=A0ABD5X5I6_9EURY|nr:hypothetical protein [Halovenus rubra]